MNFSVPTKDKSRILDTLGKANKAFQAIYPGDRPDRQPVHTVYGGADLFRADSAEKMANAALKTLLDNAPDFVEFARALEMPGHEKLPKKVADISKLVKRYAKLKPAQLKNEPAWLAYATYNKVIAKLRTEALEDFRIDFEDGFGNRSWEEEDATAVQAALEVAKGMKAKSLPPFIGIRIKPFTEDLKERGARSVSAYCTHAVLSGNALQNIEASVLDELVVTDTIPLTEEGTACTRIRQLSVAALLGESINRMSSGQSLSSMFID